MTDERDSKGNLLPDLDRLTTIGKLVRSASLDEIPQLINVVKGDISLVGPRPLLVEYLPLYNATQKRRHEVRPSITGWAQVNGRDELSIEMKVEYDRIYLEKISFIFDLKCILYTIRKVLRSEGVVEGKVD